MISENGEKLEEVISSELDKISGITDAKAKTEAIDNLETLCKLSIEDEKVGLEESKIIRTLNMEEKNHKDDEESKKNQAELDKIGFYIKTGIEIASIVLPMIFYGVWMKRGFKFEETGTYTSQTFKGLTNRFKPTK